MNRREVPGGGPLQPPKCPRCNDAGWLRVSHPRPWELRPAELLKRCPCQEGAG